MKVVVSKTALKNYHQIVDYLIETWGRSAGVQFEKRTKSFLDLLTDFPEIGINVNPERKSVHSSSLVRPEFITVS